MNETERKRVFQTLTSGKNKYYVYALCDRENVPFYVGKGTGARVEQHIADAEMIMSMMDDEPPADISDKIKRLIKEKGAVQCVIIKWGLSEKEAFMCESALINLLEFARNVKIGELTNIANGHASEAEKNSVADVATKARTLENFLQECAIRSRDIDDIRVGDRIPHVAFIKINSLYKDCLNNDGTPDNQKVKDVTRAMWRIGRDKRNSVEYVFALYRQRIVGVFRVTSVSDSVCDVYRENQSLPDFPKFPTELRKIDIWKARFSTLHEAEICLNPQDYALFHKALSAQGDPQEVLTKHRTRVYFTLNDDVPQELLDFRNCIITNSQRPEYFTGQSPVLFNW